MKADESLVAKGLVPIGNIRRKNSVTAGPARRRLLGDDRLVAYWLLSPAIIWSAIALALPIFILTSFSFSTQHQFTIDRSFSLANYLEFFDRPVFVGLLLRSLKLAFITTACTIVLAYPVAYFIAFKVHSSKWLLLIAFTIPSWTSYLLRIFSWKVILGHNGFINSVLIDLGLTDEPLGFLLYSEFAVDITLTHAWLSFAVLPIYLSLARIDRALLDAAADLGERPFFVFLRVTLPLSLPGIGVAALLIFIPTVGDYVTPALVGGPSGAMIGTMIAALFLTANNSPLGSAAAIVTIAAIVLVVCLTYQGCRLIRKALT